MRKNVTIGWKIFIIGATPVVGAGLMYALAYLFPLDSGNALVNSFFALLMILLGLAIPFIMIKTLFSAAHTQNPAEEKEIHLEDMPADKEQVERKLAVRR